MKTFCAAPWVEGLLRNNGAFQTCCHNPTSFGNWQTEGLKNCWHSEAFQSFRKKIAEGKFPDQYCKTCSENGTARTLLQELYGPFEVNLKIVFDSTIKKSFFGRVIKRFVQFIKKKKNHSAWLGPSSQEYQNALIKLKTIGIIAKSYWKRDLIPPIVAPYRQVGLIYRCNARCIHCPGRYNNEITQGKMLEEKYLDAAFDFPKGIIDFFMHGSEFLLYPDWEKIAARLVKNGTKLSLSTNGILLTPANIKYLIDHKILKGLNISIDGATKETVESIRINVNFDKLVQNIDFLFFYATEKDYNFRLSFSFALMKRNYQELPQLLRLINQIRRERKFPNVSVYYQPLEILDDQKYQEFLSQEHHSFIDRIELMETFKEVLKESRNTGITTYTFYSLKIADFIKRGCPFPPLPG